MIEQRKLNYKHTVAACSISYMIQAIVNNFAPLLFITYNKVYNIPLTKISILITINFLTQLIVDLLSAFFAQKIGYRKLIYVAHICAVVGFWCLAFLPDIIDPFLGLTLSIIIYAIGGGLLEVLISPVVEAGPVKSKSKIMSFMHSFYSWGQMLAIIVSTLFFAYFDIENRKIITLLWTLIPIFNLIYFTLVPIDTLEDKTESMSKKELFKNKTFYFMVIMMICAGASELGMSQWASAFAESGLNISKTTGDILGPCMFALFMGISRILYSLISNKISLEKYTLVSACLCLLSYLMSGIAKNPLIALSGCALCGFSVGVMWPGTYVIAHKKIPAGGTALFALLALAGDLGCSAGPGTIGFTSAFFNDSLTKGILAGGIFPTVMIAILCINILKNRRKIE